MTKTVITATDQNGNNVSYSVKVGSRMSFYSRGKLIDIPEPEEGKDSFIKKPITYFPIKQGNEIVDLPVIIFPDYKYLVHMKKFNFYISIETKINGNKIKIELVKWKKPNFLESLGAHFGFDSENIMEV